MERHRLQLEADTALVNRLDVVVAQTGAATRTEVLRRALELYDYLLQIRGRGGVVTVEEPDGTIKEIVLPRPLETV